MFKKTVQRGRSEVRDAKNNEAHGAMDKEHHVCARQRVGELAVSREPAVPEGESYTFHPPAPSLPRQALVPWPYVEPLRFTTRWIKRVTFVNAAEIVRRQCLSRTMLAGLFQHPASNHTCEIVAC